MQTFDARTERLIAPATEGLWGDAAAVQHALASMEHELARDALVFDYDAALLMRAGDIAIERTDLPPHERLALVEGVLRLQLRWIVHPLSIRSVAYPLLDAAARDLTLPASLRTNAARLLDAEARRCVAHLLQHVSEPQPWADHAQVGGAAVDDEADALFDRLGTLPTVHYALALIDLPTLAVKWRPTLIRAVTLAADELARDLETDELFAAQPQGNLLAARLSTCAWLPEETRAAVQSAYDRFIADALDATALPPERITEDYYRYVASLADWPGLQPEACARLAAFEQQYAALFAGGAGDQDTVGEEEA